MYCGRMGPLWGRTSLQYQFGRSMPYERLRFGRFRQWFHLRLRWRQLQEKHELLGGKGILHPLRFPGHEERRIFRRYNSSDQRDWEGIGEGIPHLWKSTISLNLKWLFAVIITKYQEIKISALRYSSSPPSKECPLLLPLFRPLEA